MDPSPETSRSWWFRLFSDEIVVIVAIASLAPAVYALVLLKRLQYLQGFALGVLWLVPYWILLVALHNRRIVRLPISIVCTVSVLAAFALMQTGV